MNPTHPDDQTLGNHRRGRLDERAREATTRHLQSCAACRLRADELAGADGLTLASGDAARRRSPSRPGSATARRRSGSAPRRSAWTGRRGSRASSTRCPHQVVRVPGRGGMGVVCLAQDTLMDRREALKVPNRNLLDQDGTSGRYLEEIRAAGRLGHPNVVTASSAAQVGTLLPTA